MTLRPRLTGGNGRIARFADGNTLEVAMVVWATDYRSDSGSWVTQRLHLIGDPISRRPGLHSA